MKTQTIIYITIRATSKKEFSADKFNDWFRKKFPEVHVEITRVEQREGLKI